MIIAAMPGCRFSIQYAAADTPHDMLPADSYYLLFILPDTLLILL